MKERKLPRFSGEQDRSCSKIDLGPCQLPFEVLKKFSRTENQVSKIDLAPRSILLVFKSELTSLYSAKSLRIQVSKIDLAPRSILLPYNFTSKLPRYFHKATLLKLSTCIFDSLPTCIPPPHSIYKYKPRAKHSIHSLLDTILFWRNKSLIYILSSIILDRDNSCN